MNEEALEKVFKDSSYMIRILNSNKESLNDIKLDIMSYLELIVRDNRIKEYNNELLLSVFKNLFIPLYNIKKDSIYYTDIFINAYKHDKAFYFKIIELCEYDKIDNYFTKYIIDLINTNNIKEINDNMELIKLYLIYGSREYTNKQIVEYLIKNYINKNIILDEDLLKKSFQIFAEDYALIFNKIVYIKYEYLKGDYGKVKKNKNGTYDITISDDLITDVLNHKDKSIELLFVTFFHEYRHVEQKKNMSTRYNYIFLLVLKEYLLSTYNSKNYKDFYETEYYNLFIEKDARDYSISKSIDYFKSQGFDTSKLPNMLDNYSSNENNNYNELFNEVFPKMIQVYKRYNRDIFKEYPLLTILYSKDGIRYTTKELLYIRSKTKDKTKINLINDVIKNIVLTEEQAISDYEELANCKEFYISAKDKAIFLKTNVKVLIKNGLNSILKSK